MCPRTETTKSSSWLRAALALCLCFLFTACGLRGPEQPGKVQAPRTRVVFAGDSIMEGLGPVLAKSLQTDLQQRGCTESVQAGRRSTGLCRPDYFDWPARMRGLVGDGRARLVVFCIGANDDQSVTGMDGRKRAFGSATWPAAYEGRVGEIVDIVAASGAAQVWVAPPIMKGPLGARVFTIKEIVRKACAARNVPFVDIWNTLADAKGAYQRYTLDANGNRIPLRFRDGVHVMRAGNLQLAGVVGPEVLRVLDSKQK